MYNIVIKVAAGEVTKLYAILIKILILICGKIYSKMWEFGFMSSPSIIFCISTSPKIAKTWVDDLITIIVKKKTCENFADMKNPLCTKSSFIISPQNVQI